MPPPNPSKAVGLARAVKHLAPLAIVSLLWLLRQQLFSQALLAQLPPSYPVFLLVLFFFALLDAVALLFPAGSFVGLDAQVEGWRFRAAFSLGIFNTCLNFWLLGAYPVRLYYVWFSFWTVLLIALRWAAFREKGQHYKLLEFCYVANLLALYYLWQQPQQHQLFQILFIVSNGPMAWTILALNQPLLFHSWQHLTSVFIHICPMLLTYSLRWHHSETFAVCADPLPLRMSQLQYPTPACTGISPLELLYNACAKFYVLWTLFFFLLVFVLLADKVKERGYKTLWDQVAFVPAMEKIFALFVRLGVPRQSLAMKAIYMAVHLTFALLTMAIATGFWYNQILHLTFLLFIGGCAAWSAWGLRQSWPGAPAVRRATHCPQLLTRPARTTLLSLIPRRCLLVVHFYLWSRGQGGSDQ